MSASTDEMRRAITTSGGVVFEVAELYDRVTLMDPRIVVMREVDMGTAETLRTMGRRIAELVADLDSYGVVVDLHDARGIMTAEYRKFVPDYFNQLHAGSNGAMRHLGVTFQGNPVTRIATKFFAGRMLRVPVSIHNTRALAIEAVRAALL
jgi:hypothetical protein